MAAKPERLRRLISRLIGRFYRQYAARRSHLSASVIPDPAVPCGRTKRHITAVDIPDVPR